MSAMRLAARRPGVPWRIVGIAVLAAVFAAASYKLGILVGLAALAVVLAVPLLLAHPKVAFGLWVTAFVIAENSADWNIGIFAKFYEKTPIYFSINFILLLIVAVGVLLDVRRPHVESYGPRPFGRALALVALAVVFGYVNGALSVGIPRFALLGSFEDYMTVLLAPLLVVNLVRTSEDLRRALTFFAALTILKSVLGIFAVVGGIAASQIGEGRLSYYAPTANWLCMTYLLTVGAALMARAKLPQWIVWSLPLVLASLVLSQRRSFWLATVLCLALLILIGSGRTGRRLLAPAMALIAVVVYLAAATGVVGPVQGQLISRATSLTPTKVTTNKEDRYRLAELNNVWPAIGRQPLEGLGIGVQWPERSPLPFEYSFNHYFTHFAALYWWMTCGLMGLAAYLLLMGTGIVTGLRIWQWPGEPLQRGTALGLGLAIAGMMVIELTTTILGPDVRGTALVAIAFGLLATLYRFARAADPPGPMWSPQPVQAVPNPD